MVAGKDSLLLQHRLESASHGQELLPLNLACTLHCFSLLALETLLQLLHLLVKGDNVNTCFLCCLEIMFSESFCPGRIEALRAPGGGRLQVHFQLAPAWTTAVAVSALPPPSSSSQSFSSGNLSGAACPALPTTS